MNTNQDLYLADLSQEELENNFGGNPIAIVALVLACCVFCYTLGKDSKASDVANGY